MSKRDKQLIENYREINGLPDGQSKPRLLLHTCCAPCASGVLDAIKNDFEVTVYFYNPNILPNDEFKLRLDALKTLLMSYTDINLILPSQQQASFLSAVAGFENTAEGGIRCDKCFNLRLENTAEYLFNNNSLYDCFATTLTISPHKDADKINRIGKVAAAKYGVSYLSSDFKKQNGYLKSIENSKRLGLYRQTYCGCNFNVNRDL